MFIDLRKRERGGRERHTNVREKHRLVASHLSPDRKSNPQHFGDLDDAPTNRATWLAEIYHSGNSGHVQHRATQLVWASLHVQHPHSW